MLFAGLISASNLQAATLHVDDDTVDPVSGWFSDPYSLIQDGIYTAIDGDGYDIGADETVYRCNSDTDCDDNNLCTVDICSPEFGCYYLRSICQDDKNPCTTDSCDPETGQCIYTPLEDETSCDNTCVTGKCLSGECIGTELDCDDGDLCTVDSCSPNLGCVYARRRCRDDGNPCTINTCDPETGQCTRTLVENKTPCDDVCTTGECLNGECIGTKLNCDDGDLCTDDNCIPKSGCVHYPPLCLDDNNLCTIDECDPETGQCTHTPLEDETPCDDACTSGECLNGECVGTERDCDDSNLCSVDSCIPGYGCVHHKPPCLDDGNSCTTDRCDPETGQCTHTLLEDETPCNNACVTGTCLNGECIGTEVNCDDGDPCTQESCSPNFGCVYARRKCWDDRNPCTIDTCDPETGQCIHTPLEDETLCGDVCVTGTCLNGECIGTELDCDDGDLCTNDRCVPKSGCVHHPACLDDRNPCTIDTCNPETGECIYNPVENKTPCDDACTSGECLSGECVGTERDCDDKNLCSVDSCIPGHGCVHYKPDCLDDDNLCTIDECDPETGQCTHTPLEDESPCDNTCITGKCSNGECIGTELDCDDGDLCTRDRCSPYFGCVYARLECRDDKNPCTIDECNPETGKCHEPVTDGTACENACTVEGECLSGECVGKERDCNDGNFCTYDSCIFMSGCIHFPKGCLDENPCTTDTCDPRTGRCIHTPLEDESPCDNTCITGKCLNGECIGTELDCDDGDLCTRDRCSPYFGCDHYPPACLDDNNLCTIDECDPETGQCTHTPLEDESPCDNSCITGKCLNGECIGTELDCDDGDLCTRDSCSPKFGCINAGRRCLDDRNPCTIDKCNPDTGNCYDPVADGTVCDDFNACTTNDICLGMICEGEVEEGCNSPPDCSNAYPSVSRILSGEEIWSPNHKMVEVKIMGVTDPDEDSINIIITGITQDEPVNSIGDGNTYPDGDGIDTSIAQVRAERAGPENSRIYEISFIAEDDLGEQCSGSVQVCVPHDQGEGDICIDDGQNYTSTDWFNFTVAIAMESDPIEVCFTPEVTLNADPFISFVTGNGTLKKADDTEIQLGSKMTVSPVNDPCTKNLTYCVYYTPPEGEDTEVRVTIEEDPLNPVYPGFLGSEVADFLIDSDYEKASSFCIYNIVGGKGSLPGDKCKTDEVAFEVYGDDLDLKDAVDKDGKLLRDIDCIPVKIVVVDPLSIPRNIPHNKTTKLCDIDLPDRVVITQGQYVTVSLSFVLADGSKKQDFEKSKKSFEVFYYNEITQNWETDGIKIINIQWHSNTTGAITFTSTHLTTFAASSKNTSPSTPPSNNGGDGSQAASASGCSVTPNTDDMSAGSAFANVIIFLLPLIIFRTRSALNSKKKYITD